MQYPFNYLFLVQNVLQLSKSCARLFLSVFFCEREREREAKKKEMGRKRSQNKFRCEILCDEIAPQKERRKKSKSNLVVESSNNITWRKEISSVSVSDLT